MWKPSAIAYFAFLFAILIYPWSLAPTASAAPMPDDVKKCVVCHRSNVKDFLPTTHAKLFLNEIGNETGKGACEACHGDGDRHRANVKEAGKQNADLSLITRLGEESPLSAGEKNAICMQCHEKNDSQMFWSGSGHESSGVSCLDCHNKKGVLPVKIAKEPVARHLSGKIDKVSEQCGTCHTQKRAMMMRSSHMPLREGKISCADCHNPHGGVGPANLRQISLNENCYSCHAEKRGPMLWEHPPVREDCSNCHESHGSNNPTLLKMKQPYLCQSCHMANYHPSELYSAEGIPSHGGAAKQALYKGCLNCHPQVHGSNHPSGPRFTR